MLNHREERKKKKTIHSGILCAFFCYKRRTDKLSDLTDKLSARPQVFQALIRPGKSGGILAIEWEITFCVVPCLVVSLKPFLSPNSKHAHQRNRVREHRERERRRRDPSMLWELMVSTRTVFNIHPHRLKM